MEIDFVRSRFIKHFDGKTGNIYASPGRINLIGEHTDYNGGFVFPGAVEQGIMVEIRPNGHQSCNIYSIDMKDMCHFKLDDPKGPDTTWARYIFGICKEMMALGIDVKPFNAAFAGDVPLGAGMSSSAALESCFGFALNDLFGDNKASKWDIALAGQATEHKYVGVKCGIMDQFASVFGQKGKLMRLDCRSREFEYFPWDPKGYKLVLLNSKVKHELVGSPYNDRRNSCENVVKAMKDNYDVVGQKMYETHEGLSKEYEVSCEELDYLNELAKENGVTGSRIMGGGFGGCTINLVKEDVYDKFIADAKVKFAAKYGHEPSVIDVVIGDGSRRIC